MDKIRLLGANNLQLGLDASCILYNNLPLTLALESLPASSGTYLLILTELDGFYICDSNGYYIMKVDQITGLSVINDTSDISFIEPNKISTLKRYTESGYFESDVYRLFFELRDTSLLNYDFCIDTNLFICRDYVLVDSNVKFTLVGYEFTKGNLLKVSVHFDLTYKDAWISVDYALANDDLVAKVQISIPSTKTNPEISTALHIFNADATVVIITDDNGISDFYKNWCHANGYYYDSTSVKHGEDILNNLAGGSTVVNPWTFSNGVGGERRFESSHAVMTPTDVFRDNLRPLNDINIDDVKIMLSMGDSLTWHDLAISKCLTLNPKLGSYFNIEKLNLFLQSVGINTIKIATEPSGAKDYTLLMIYDQHVCMVAFLAGGKAVYNGQEYQISNLRSDISNFINGNPTSFKYHDQVALERYFVNADSIGYADLYETLINAAIESHKVQSFGFHGWGSTIVVPTMENIIRTKNNVAYISVDHLWEYYNIYNNIVIDNVIGDGSNVTATLWIPHCNHELYGEITLNLNLTDGGLIQVSDNVIGLSYKQNSDKYTVNLAICKKWIDNKNYWKQLKENNPTNEKINRDYLYLNSLLRDGLKDA